MAVSGTGIAAAGTAQRRRIAAPGGSKNSKATPPATNCISARYGNLAGELW